METLAISYSSGLNAKITDLPSSLAPFEGTRAVFLSYTFQLSWQPTSGRFDGSGLWLQTVTHPTLLEMSHRRPASEQLSKAHERNYFLDTQTFCNQQRLHWCRHPIFRCLGVGEVTKTLYISHAECTELWVSLWRWTIKKKPHVGNKSGDSTYGCIHNILHACIVHVLCRRQHTGMLQITQLNSAFPVKPIVKPANITQNFKVKVGLHFTYISQEEHFITKWELKS